MPKITTPENWVTIFSWHTRNFVGWEDACGLYRVMLHGQLMFIGHAAKGGLGPRLLALRRPKGAGRKHHAGSLIYQYRAEITMQIAVLSLPPDDIIHRLAQLLDEHRPLWNVPNGHYRDF